MRRLFVFAMSAVMVLMLAASAFAVGPGKTVEFDGKGAGKVIFDGKSHAGAKCAECHPKIFKMKKGTSKITMAEHVPGKMCGVCHDGTKAFDQGQANCAKCHKK